MKKTIIGFVSATLILIVAGFVYAAEDGSSPLSPAPIGKTLSGIVECGSGYTSHELYDMNITLLEVVRGEEAWKRLKEASASNKPAPAGFEYVLARIKYEYHARGSPGLCAERLSPQMFTAYAADGSGYEPISVALPKPEMNGSVHSGESLEGWVAFAVPQQDKTPIMNYSADLGGAIVHGGDKWFQLH